MPLFKRVARDAGAVGVTEDHNHGWSNQPMVMVFSCTEKVMVEVKRALETYPPFTHPLASPIVYKKDW